MSQSKDGNKKLSRREFLEKAGTAAAALTMGISTPGQSGQKADSANDQLGIGVIGVGGRGNAHLQMLKWMQDNGDNIRIAAVCDIYQPRLQRAAQDYNAKAYKDYKQLLADKNVDIVCIATPDHHHGYQAIDAIEAGKDIYCEKPVTHWRQFELTRKLAEAAKKSDRIFQLGTQGMSDSVWHQMKKLVKDGLIGKPVYGETGFFRIGDWGERGMPIDDPNAKPGQDLDWEAFLGDAAKKDFSVDRFFRWRLFEDYAGGPATDLYPHCLTQLIDVMGVDVPETVTGLGGINRYDYELREVPDTFNLLAQYPEKVSITVLGTQANDFNATPLRGSGQRCPVIRGWDGTLTISPDNREIIFTPIKVTGAKNPQTFKIDHEEDNVLHWRNLIECCRNRSKNTWSPMDLAFRTQTVLQMAMLSFKVGKSAHFDKGGQIKQYKLSVF